MKKKNSTSDDVIVDKKKGSRESEGDEPVIGEDSAIDPAVIEDTFTEDAEVFSEYNDVDYL